MSRNPFSAPAPNRSENPSRHHEGAPVKEPSRDTEACQPKSTFAQRSPSAPVAEIFPNIGRRVALEKVELIMDTTLPGLTMEEKSCRSCAHYAFAPGTSRVIAANGECRRCAPVPGGSARAQWPMVNWDQWCGEWKNGVSNEDLMRLARDIGEIIDEEV